MESSLENIAIFQIAARFDLSKNLKIRMSIGEGYRSPSLREKYFDFTNSVVGYTIQGNPELLPERSLSYNFSIENKVSEKFWFFANFFHNRVKNLIDYLNISQTEGDLLQYRNENIEAARIQGLELSFRFKIRKGSFLN